ncbi:hypothetical protein LguiA_018289 [Lonicera macranthoides]
MLATCSSGSSSGSSSSSSTTTMRLSAGYSSGASISIISGITYNGTTGLSCRA